MTSRRFEKYWIYFGLILGIPYYFDLINIPDISLSVLSIFFGGLLTIYLVLPCVQNFKQFEYIVKSGHITDLIDYIKVPVVICLILIFFDFARALNVKFVTDTMRLIFNAVYLALWGVFLLSLVRIILLLPKILLDQKVNEK